MGKGKVQPALRNISRHNGFDTHESGHFSGTLMFEVWNYFYPFSSCRNPGFYTNNIWIKVYLNHCKHLFTVYITHNIKVRFIIQIISITSTSFQCVVEWLYRKSQILQYIHFYKSHPENKQLQWKNYVVRMDNHHISKILFLSKLFSGHENKVSLQKRYRQFLKRSFTSCRINSHQ